MQDLRLTAGAHLYRFDAPVGDGSLFLAEHTLAGAGGIDQYLVERTGEALGQNGGIFIGHQRVGNTHAFNVLGQDLRPLGTPFIAEQEAFSQHTASDLCGLATGGGAKVADPLAGLRIQQGNRCHGTGLLQIIYAGFVINVQTGTGSGIVVETHRLPRHRLPDKGQLRRVALQGIEAQRYGTGTFQRTQEIFIFITQLVFHSI